LRAVSLDGESATDDVGARRRRFLRVAVWGAGVLLLTAAILTVGLLLAG
jgi:hypothetical protein